MVGLLLASTIAFGKTQMVFMGEEGTAKQIFLKQGKKITQLTSGDDWHIYPDISPDGMHATFLRGSGMGQMQVMLMNLKDKEIFPLTEVGNFLHPKFSRTGDFITVAVAGERGKYQVAKIDLKVDPTKERATGFEILKMSQTDSEDHFFPSSLAQESLMVFQKNTEQILEDGTKKSIREVVLYDLFQEKAEVIAQGMAPSLSFNDQLIAYTKQVDGNWDVYIYNRHDKTTTRATFDSNRDFAPSFDRKGNLIWASDRSGNFKLYKIKHSKIGKEPGAINPIVDLPGDVYAPRHSGNSRFSQDENAPIIGEPRSSFGAITHKGKTYIVGGHQGFEHTYPPESFVDRLTVYDPVQNVWSELAPRPHKAHGYQVVGHGKYLYAFGGFAYSDQHKPAWKSLTAVDRYNIETNTWETIAQLPRARSSNVSIKVGHKVFLMGGWNATPKFENDYDGKFHAEIDVFNLRTGKFKTLKQQLPDPLRRAFTAVSRKGKIYLVGGLGVGATHFELLDTVTEFDPVTKRFTELPKLPFATFAPAAGFIGKNLFVFGGMFKTGKYNYEYVSNIYRHRLGKKDWINTGRFLQETKGFAQVIKLGKRKLGVLGGHHYFSNEKDAPVPRFETFSLNRKKDRFD